MLQKLLLCLIMFTVFIHCQSQSELALKKELAKTTALLKQAQRQIQHLQSQQSRLDKQSTVEILQQVERFERQLDSLDEYIQSMAFPRDIYYIDGEIPKTDILGIMDWFAKKFHERMRGTLSDLIVTVRDTDSNYDELEQKITKHPFVKACAPRLSSLVLIGTERYYAGGMVVGIDYQKERQVGKFSDYLVTPYVEWKMQTENTLPKNARYETAFSWQVIGGGPVPGDGIFPAGFEVICKKTTQVTFAENTTQSRENYEAYTFNDATPPQIIFVERGSTLEDYGDIAKLSPADQQKWQKVFDSLATHFANNDLSQYMAHFSPTLRTPENSLQIDDPFRVPGEIEQDRPLIVGYELMRQLNLKRGDEIGLITGNRQKGELNAVQRNFTVVGSFRSGWQEVDARMCYVQRKDLQGFVDWKSDVREILVAVKDLQDIDKAKRELSAMLNSRSSSFVVETWQDRRRTLLAAMAMEREVVKKFIEALTTARQLCEKVRSELGNSEK